MDLGYLKTIIRGIPDAKTRQVMEQFATHIAQNFRFGEPEHQTRSENAQLYWQQSTTASDTSEFTIAHGITGTTPRYAIPVLELDRVGSKVGGLTVSRAADGSRIYLKADAGSTNAGVTLLVE